MKATKGTIERKPPKDKDGKVIKGLTFSDPVTVTNIKVPDKKKAT